MNGSRSSNPIFLVRVGFTVLLGIGAYGSWQSGRDLLREEAAQPERNQHPGEDVRRMACKPRHRVDESAVLRWSPGGIQQPSPCEILQSQAVEHAHRVSFQVDAPERLQVA